MIHYMTICNKTNRIVIIINVRYQSVQQTTHQWPVNLILPICDSQRIPTQSWMLTVASLEHALAHFLVPYPYGAQITKGAKRQNLMTLRKNRNHKV